MSAIDLRLRPPRPRSVPAPTGVRTGENAQGQARAPPRGLRASGLPVQAIAAVVAGGEPGLDAAAVQHSGEAHFWRRAAIRHDGPRDRVRPRAGSGPAPRGAVAVAAEPAWGVDLLGLVAGRHGGPGPLPQGARLPHQPRVRAPDGAEQRKPVPGSPQDPEVGDDQQHVRGALQAPRADLLTADEE
eukprot:CAMPEP_0170257054 /NCGR_PEP_ID=MMETSP0116_2-20130129/28382_1 /TAXON_ID=400756 /ORGANISM="Durinskia baltica, Strain CSIRO CS-38" /LENGTH=185 /DNA_ID=CAMNT_0010508067 /DNA_START=21 /DNA_END=579 /DNA_ORIENTATION=+